MNEFTNVLFLSLYCMKRFLIIFILTIVVGSESIAQETIFEEARTIYRRETSYGLMIHTSGWGGSFRKGTYLDGFSKRMLEIELVGMKHSKQIKNYNPFLDNTRGYFYGKLNSLSVLRTNMGYHKTFISKQSVRGVSISYLLHGGLSVGYAKPIYLLIIEDFDENGNLILETHRYDAEKHTVDNIYGRASAFKGLFSGRVYPGAFAKAGLSFESSRNPDKINALEVGMTLDAYLEEIPIMALTNNKQFYFNLYVALYFGGKKVE